MVSPATYGAGVNPKGTEAARASATRSDPPLAKVVYCDCSKATSATYGTGVHPKANEAVRVSVKCSQQKMNLSVVLIKIIFAEGVLLSFFNSSQE